MSWARCLGLVRILCMGAARLTDTRNAFPPLLCVPDKVVPLWRDRLQIRVEILSTHPGEVCRRYCGKSGVGLWRCLLLVRVVQDGGYGCMTDAIDGCTSVDCGHRDVAATYHGTHVPSSSSPHPHHQHSISRPTRDLRWTAYASLRMDPPWDLSQGNHLRVLPSTRRHYQVLACKPHPT